MKILLASSSPQRIKLLKTLGYEIKTISPNIEELDEKSGLSGIELAKKNSFLKAKAVLGKYRLQKDEVLLAADSVVAKDRQIFGKPQSSEHAFTMLKVLNNCWHEVYTGYTIIGPNEQLITEAVTAKVLFRDLSDFEIRSYIETNECMDKAGAYAVQGLGASLVQEVNGSISNVIGLPVKEVLRGIKQMARNT